MWLCNLLNYVIYQSSSQYNLLMLILSRKRIIGPILITNLIISVSPTLSPPCVWKYILTSDVPTEFGATITGASD